MKLPPGHVAGQGVSRPTGYGGLGERLLKGMGWEKGQGLGRRRDGIKEAIAVKKKEDTVGVGGSTSWAWADNFWEKAFDQASARAASKSLLQPSDSSSSSSIADESDTSSDEGHERPATKPSNKGASISDGSSDSSTSDSSSDSRPPSLRNKDGTLASGSTDELRLLASLSKGSGRVAAGRFSGRGAKMARLRAQEESAAQALATGGSVRAETGMAKKTSSSEFPCVEETHTRTVVEIAAVSPELATPLAAFVPTPSVGWWGCALFQSAGCLADPSADRARAAQLERAAEAAGKRGFGEDDQAAVYMAAFAGQTKGRVGLGQGSGPLKIGGVKWGGTRTVLEEEVGEDGQGREEASVAGTWTGAAGWPTLVAEVCSSVARKRLALSTLVALLRPRVARALEESEWAVPSDREMRKELRLRFQTSQRATPKSKERKSKEKKSKEKTVKEKKSKEKKVQKKRKKQ